MHRISNKETSALLLGAAFDPNTEEIYYASIVAPQNTIASIRATLLQGGHIYITIAALAPLRKPEGSHAETFVVPLPDTTYVHATLTFRLPQLVAIYLNTDQAKNLRTFDNLELERTKLLEARMDEAHQQLVTALNEHTEIPVLREWGKTLWHKGVVYGLVRQVSALGDCLGAWRISLEPHLWMSLLKDNKEVFS